MTAPQDLSYHVVNQLTRDDHPQYARADGTRPITGTQTVAALAVTGNETVGGTLGVTGAITGPDLALTGLTGATATGRYVGYTTSGAPSSGTFAAGDVVIDNTGAMFVCITAGTPGTWSVPVGGLVGFAQGPSVQTDFVNGTTNAFTLAVPLVNGLKYEVVLSLSLGTQITAAGTGACGVFATDSSALIPGTNLRAVEAASPALGYLFTGTGSTVITATSTATDTFTAKVTETTSGGAMRLQAATLFMYVKRVA